MIYHFPNINIEEHNYRYLYLEQYAEDDYATICSERVVNDRYSEAHGIYTLQGAKRKVKKALGYYGKRLTWRTEVSESKFLPPLHTIAEPIKSKKH